MPKTADICDTVFDGKSLEPPRSVWLDGIYTCSSNNGGDIAF